MKDFAVRLNKALFMKGIRPIELSEKSGINRGDLSHYIHGDNVPGAAKLAKIADALGVSADWLLGKEEISDARLTKDELSKVPVLGSVAAGVPIYAQEDVIGSVLVDDPEGMFALRVKGDSMSPRIMDGDLVIVRAQDSAEDGDLVIALVGDSATCKVLKRSSWGVSLVPFNPAFSPLVYGREEAEELRILGVVKESRHEWK